MDIIFYFSVYSYKYYKEQIQFGSGHAWVSYQEGERIFRNPYQEEREALQKPIPPPILAILVLSESLPAPTKALPMLDVKLESDNFTFDFGLDFGLEIADGAGLGDAGKGMNGDLGDLVVGVGLGVSVGTLGFVDAVGRG